jgi:hypothetical protein
VTPEQPVEEEAPQDIVCSGGIRLQLGAGNRVEELDEDQ